MMGINPKTWKKIGIVTGLTWGLLLVGLFFRHWQKRRRQKAEAERPQPSPIPQQIQGLTGEQVAALLPPQNDKGDEEAKRRNFIKTATRQTLFSIFNFNLFAMMIVNLLLDNPVGLLLSVILLLISIGLRVYEIVYTKNHMDEIVKSVRPRASVIRDGQLHSIDPSQIVPNDTLTISKGDEILVDGTLAGHTEITIEKVDASGIIKRVVKKPGEDIPAGSYCVNGRGIYIANEGGWLRHNPEEGYQFDLMETIRTPLQRSIETILYVLLGIVAVFSIILIMDGILSTKEIVLAEYRNAFSIIFGIAPTSLMMLLILKNIVGVVRLSRRGALVYNPQSIEALSQVKTICISRESLVGGLLVTVKPIKGNDGEEPFSENIIRHILGNMIHSTYSYDPALQKLADAIPGDKIQVIESAQFWESLGWVGVTFEDPDRQGTYILGKQEVLNECLRKKKRSIKEHFETVLSGARREMVKLLENAEDKDEETDINEEESLRTESGSEIEEQSESPDESENESKPPIGIRIRDTLLHWLKPMEELEKDQEEEPEQLDDEPALILAYLPKPAPLFDREGQPQLPKKLVPLAYIQIDEFVRPETQEAVNSLLNDGIRIKILSALPMDEITWIADDLGIPYDKNDDLSDNNLNKTLFSDLTPAGKAEVVNALRKEDPYVIMIGSAVNDIPAMQQAFLGVVPRSASQAALQMTDIVLLDESINALPRVFSEGQRMINGVLTTFKLYLSKVLMQFLLILLLLFGFMKTFPYQSAQAGVASVFTVTIPNIFLVVWASARRLSKESIRRQLFRFIFPVGIGLTALVWGFSALYTGKFEVDPQFAHYPIAYILLFEGWVRVFFVQPPDPFWAGGTPLRGDKRVYRVVLGSALLLIVFLIIPFFRKVFRIPWPASLQEFGIILLVVLTWTLFMKAVWWVIGKIEQHRDKRQMEE